MTARAVLLVVAVTAACEAPHKAARIAVDQIVVVSEAMLRTTPVGGRMTPNEIEVHKKLTPVGTVFYVGDSDAVDASYVMVDAENRSEHDAYATLDGTLVGPNRTAPLKAESLFVPAGGTRTFLLLDDALKPEPWATGVKVIVTGAIAAKFPPGMAVSDMNVFTDGDHVVSAATVTNTTKREGKGIVHAAFHDAAGKPVARGHTVLVLGPGASETVRFVGPPGSKTGTIYPGDSTY